MKKRKLLICSILGLTLLAGCGGGDTNKDEGGKTKDGKTKLTAIVVKHTLTRKNSTLEWLKKLEEDNQVEVKWEEVSADWGQKKAPMLASGDVPDIIIGGGNVVSDEEFVKFNGLFEDLSKHMDEMPNVKRMFDEHPEMNAFAKQLDGAIYGLPHYKRFWYPTTTQQYINQNWLDNLGLEKPTTWDELYDVLVAFKEKDANGNGDPNDEIPFDWAPVGTTGFGTRSPLQFLASLGITVVDGGNLGYFAEDGKVKSLFTDERYKEVVQFLNKLWKAGLVNPKGFSQDYSAFQSTGRGEGDLAKVGFSFGFTASDRYGAVIEDQYSIVEPLKVDANTEVPTWNYEYKNYGSNVAVVSAKSKNKEAAIKFLDAMYDPEVSLEILFGSLGTGITKEGDTYKVMPPEDPKMDAGTWKWTSSWADVGPKYIADDLKVDLPADIKEMDADYANLLPLLDKIDPEKQAFPNGFMKYDPQDAVTLSNNNTTILNEAMTKFATWVTKGGIEKDWDKFVETLEKNGLNENLEIQQKGYDNFYKNYN